MRSFQIDSRSRFYRYIFKVYFPNNILIEYFEHMTSRGIGVLEHPGLRFDNGRRWVVSEVPGRVIAWPVAAPNPARMYNKGVSLAMPVKDEVLAFWVDRQSKGCVARTSLQAGVAATPYKVSLGINLSYTATERQ